MKAPQNEAKGGAGPEARSVGKKLRDLRHERELTIGELARLSGVPVSTISKIENDLLNPSLVHSINLASALDANLGFLVDRDHRRADTFTVVRGARRAEIDFPEMALTLQDLNANFVPGILEARLGIIAPGAHSGEEAMRHDGEELCFVIAGAIRYEIGDRVIDLQAEESLHLKAEDAHRWQNASEGPTTVLWVFSDGLSF